ncbi:MAG TPA: M48 family metalloprotease, partial [Kofleriaceae bacterium]
LAARLEYRDAKLTAYVQGVTDRLVRASKLKTRARVLITEVGPTASAVVGDLLIMNRNALSVLDSEDELAAVLAHELVHLESDHATQLDVEDDPVWRLDLESAADERAIDLLREAGYSPHAMLAMLRAISRDDTVADPTHPTSLQRLARAAVLIGDAPPRSLTREPYRQQIEGLVLGSDPRLIQFADAAITSLAADVAVDEPGEESESITVNATLVERPRGDDVASMLERRREHHIGGKHVITGMMPAVPRTLAPVDALLRDQLLAVASIPGDGTHVIVIRGDRDLVLELTGDDLDHWTDLLVREVRRPTAAERAAIKPHRLRYVPAPSDGTYSEIAKRACAGYAEFPLLDDPARTVTRGERIKCAVK